MGRIGEPGLASVHPIFFQPKGKKKDQEKMELGAGPISGRQHRSTKQMVLKIIELRKEKRIL
jgi:hypothetical protein